jgi:hypothetical protein
VKGSQDGQDLAGVGPAGPRRPQTPAPNPGGPSATSAARAWNRLAEVKEASAGVLAKCGDDGMNR